MGDQDDALYLPFNCPTCRRKTVNLYQHKRIPNLAICLKCGGFFELKTVGKDDFG